MQSYSAARGYFSFIGLVAWAALILGGILALSGANAGSRGGLMTSMVGAAPGILLMMIGSFILVYVQTARATVDTAEYTQQALKLSRDHFEVSKQLLAAAQPANDISGYAAEAATGLKNVSYDTEQTSANDSERLVVTKTKAESAAVENSEKLAIDVDEQMPLAAMGTFASEPTKVHEYKGSHIEQHGKVYLVEGAPHPSLTDAKYAVRQNAQKARRTAS